MYKKDFIFFLVLALSIAVLVLDLVFIGLGVWRMIQLNTFDILNLDSTRPFTISMIAINSAYVVILALYLSLRRVR